MSQQVLWEVVKNQNAFLVKNNGLRFSRDPYNNSGLQTYSHTGFIQTDAVGVLPGTAGKKNNFRVTLRKATKYQQTSQKASKSNAETTVYSSTLPVRHGVHTVAKTIQKRFGNRRQGLQKLALKRLVKLNRAIEVRRRNELAAAKAQKK